MAKINYKGIIMAINCGIVGLPNVGKSTIFSALTNTPAEAANYPFCTINPNVGIVSIPDLRLKKLSDYFQPKKTINAAVEFVDIAGLVKGASQGEGLGNQFLSHIREVGVIAHVVRCFNDDDIVHVAGKIAPASDIETINIELALADLASLDKRAERAEKAARMGKDAQKEAAVVLKAIEKIRPLLQEGKGARLADLTEEQKAAIYDAHLITMKPQMYVCNVDEAAMKNGNEYTETVKKIAQAENADSIIICGKFEADLADLETEEERLSFLNEAGLEESGLSRLAKAAYHLIGLRTFFTAGEDECRAWTIHAGDTAPKAAGVIHTDFEKGFIKAEVYGFDDFLKYGSEQKIKEAGRYRQEGKAYIVQDGDIMFFKFNV